MKCVVLQGSIGSCKSSTVFGCAASSSSPSSFPFFSSSPSSPFSPFSSPSSISPYSPLNPSPIPPTSSLPLLPSSLFVHPPLVPPQQTKQQFRVKEIHPGLLRFVLVVCVIGVFVCVCVVYLLNFSFSLPPLITITYLETVLI